MKLSLGLTTSMPIVKSRRYARIADDIGLHRVIIGEDILSREIFTYLTVIALETKNIKLATGITSPYVRNIAVIASTSIGIQRITDNRFTLGLGPGGIPEVEKFTGRKLTRPVAVLTETTSILRQLFDGERIHVTGVRAKLDGLQLNTKGVVPPKIFFGVRGEKLLSLAGEIADGVIFSGSKHYLSRAKKIVDEATVRAGRTEESVKKLIWNGFVNVVDNADLRLARLVVATMVSSLPEKEIERQDSVEEISRIKTHFMKGEYKKAEKLVTDDLLADFCFAGSLDDILEEFEQYRQVGFTEFIVGPPFGNNPEDTLKALESRIGDA